MRFQAYDERLAAVETLSVDGVAPLGPNLSHWPGNRTPAALKADTSTEIVLKALTTSALPALVREILTIEHHDTDGVLSCYAALHPAFALDHAQLFRDAAWAGDLLRYTSRDAVVLDLALAGLNEHKASPLVEELAGLSPQERLQRVFTDAFERLPELIAHPRTLIELWEEPLREIEEGLLDFQRGLARVLFYEPFAELVAIASPVPLARMSFRTRAPQARTLLAIGAPGRLDYSLRDEIDSWFDLVTVSTPKRVPLGPLAEELGSLDVVPWVEESGPSTLTPRIGASGSRLTPREVADVAVRHLAPRGNG